MGCLLFSDVLDVKHNWLGNILLALETYRQFGKVTQVNLTNRQHYIMGWLRDYLWLNSSPLINGYNPFGMNSLSVWAWTFLFGSFNLGNRFHVLNFMAWLLARIDRDT
jgi:hypothetical protein